MRLLVILIFYCQIACSQASDSLTLINRVKAFNKKCENVNLDIELYSVNIKPFLDPYSNTDSIARRLYGSWKQLLSETHNFTTEVIGAKIDRNNARVSISEIWNYEDGVTVCWFSITFWYKNNGIWYRENKKSELYKDGIRVR